MKWFHSEIRLIKNGNVYHSPVYTYMLYQKPKLPFIYTEYAWIYGPHGKDRKYILGTKQT